MTPWLLRHRGGRSSDDVEAGRDDPRRTEMAPGRPRCHRCLSVQTSSSSTPTSLVPNYVVRTRCVCRCHGGPNRFGTSAGSGRRAEELLLRDEPRFARTRRTDRRMACRWVRGAAGLRVAPERRSRARPSRGPCCRRWPRRTGGDRSSPLHGRAALLLHATPPPSRGMGALRQRGWRSRADRNWGPPRRARARRSDVHRTARNVAHDSENER